jgi:hypothetical protein
VGERESGLTKIEKERDSKEKQEREEGERMRRLAH